jgi:diaminopimelate decarboxylase
VNRLGLFPVSTRIENDSLSVAGLHLDRLAEEFGTPLYVYDRATLDASTAAYQRALSAHYPAPASLTYAGKAFLCKAVAQWTQFHGLTVDCTGEAEMRIAAAGEVPREHLLVHGVNKSDADLSSALGHAGTIVIDNLAELRKLYDILEKGSGRVQAGPSLWLRLLPGLAVHTHHAHTQTGQPGSKFGMTPGECLEAAGFCRERGLPLNGIHFHQGSNFRDPEPLIPAVETALDLAQELRFSGEWHFCPGGGWSVAYREDELPNPSITDYVRGAAEAVIEGCSTRRLDRPHLHLEPGRSLIARAGVALYRVGAVKRRGERTWLLVDGGMADNPRPAMYGARYSCLPASGLTREMSELVSIGGPFCESGDVLIEDLAMPKIEAGELIAVPVSGAYHLSMASNYNGARRPAVVWLEEGTARLIIRRETTDDLMARDLGW